MLDKSGIVVQDQVDAAAVAGQVVGFSSSTVRNAYEGESAIAQYDHALQARRSTLVEQIAMAAMAGDEEDKADARADIEEPGPANPAPATGPERAHANQAHRAGARGCVPAGEAARCVGGGAVRCGSVSRDIAG